MARFTDTCFASAGAGFHDGVVKGVDVDVLGVEGATGEHDAAAVLNQVAGVAALDRDVIGDDRGAAVFGLFDIIPVSL